MKKYFDPNIHPLTVHTSRPTNPIAGDYYYDVNTNIGLVYTGLCWSHFSGPTPSSLIPTEQELRKHPSLKNAWEQYLITRKLLGL